MIQAALGKSRFGCLRRWVSTEVRLDTRWPLPETPLQTMARKASMPSVTKLTGGIDTQCNNEYVSPFLSSLSRRSPVTVRGRDTHLAAVHRH